MFANNIQRSHPNIVAQHKVCDEQNAIVIQFR